MKRFSSFSVPLMLVVASVEASAEAGSSESTATTDCSVIVSQTVSEMRVGAKAWWSDDVEKMAGMAAMSACFKVVSQAVDELCWEPRGSLFRRLINTRCDGTTERIIRFEFQTLVRLGEQKAL